MTWVKLGDEFIDQCANADLADAAFRTHVEAIGWLYRNEDTSCRVRQAIVLRFAGSLDWKSGIDGLVAAGFWKDYGDGWEIVHHADVIRQSIAAQRIKREQDRDRQRQRRARATAAARSAPGVTRDVAATQTDRQAGSKETDHQPTVGGRCIAVGCKKRARHACSTCWEHAAQEPPEEMPF
jgi:hypothetical protein